MRAACTECSLVIDTVDDLCPHRHPVCWSCCHDVHPFRFPDEEKVA